MHKQTGAVTDKRNLQMPVMEEPDFDRFERIGSSFELPDADEFVCTEDEVREACSGLEGIHDSLMD